MVETTHHDPDAVAAATHVQALMQGQPPNGASPDAFGARKDLILNLHEVYAVHGTTGVREFMQAYLQRHPEEMWLTSMKIQAVERKVRWTADELLVHEFPPTRWIAPGYFPEGLTILAGRPKIGKSWLALQVVHSVSSGGTLFNERLDQAPALYIAYEDAARRLKKRMKAQEWPAYTKATFYTEWPSLDRGGLSQLEQAMAEEMYRLVVIDTLSRALSGKPDQNSVGDMTVVLSQLQHLALAREALILVIDHHSKVHGTSPDPVDDILGSTGKGAVADCAVGLYRQRGQKAATLHISGRDLDEDKKLALEWQARWCRWDLLGDADRVAQDTLQAAILVAVDELGGKTSLLELAAFLGKNRGSISRELNELLNKAQ